MNTSHKGGIMTTFKDIAKEENTAFLKESQNNVVKEKEGAKDEQKVLIQSKLFQFYVPL